MYVKSIETRPAAVTDVGFVFIYLSKYSDFRDPVKTAKGRKVCQMVDETSSLSMELALCQGN